MDVEKQMAWWRDGSREDMGAALVLLEKGKLRHALFFAHLAMEKLLKAHVVRTTGDIPPRLHDLLRLAEIAGIVLSAERREFLARFQRYCLEGRYPDMPPASPLSSHEADEEVRDAKETIAWLTRLLK